MKHTRATLTGLAWVSPWLIGCLAFTLLPVAMTLYFSFTDYPILERPLWTGLDNFKALLTDPVFALVLKNTLIYAALSIPLQTVAALAVAALLNNPLKGVGFYRAAVFVPAIVPTVACAMIWYWLFNGELGLVNQGLRMVGGLLPAAVASALPEGLRDLLAGPAWLSTSGWAMAALVVVSVWNIGQSVVIYLAAMQDVPKSLYEAASIDGAGPVRRFITVTLPGVSPVVLFNVVTGLINTWQVFAVPYIMTEGGPDRSTLFYSMYLYQAGFIYQKLGYAGALAWVQFLIIMALTALTFAISRNLVLDRSA